MTYRLITEGTVPAPLRLAFSTGMVEVTEWPRVQSERGLWESYGICSHPNFGKGVYADTDAWVAKYEQIGAYAFRGMLAANLSHVQRTLELAKAKGLKWLAQVATETKPGGAELRDRLDLIAANPDVFVGIEGINEPDSDGLKPAEVDRVVAVQETIWDYVQIHDLDIPVLSPALRRPAGSELYRRLADAGLLGTFDVVSLHHYGKGGMILLDGPDGLTAHLDMVQDVWQCDRFWITETGSTNALESPDPRRCSEAASAAYAVRNFLDLTSDPRVEKVYRYELLDDDGPLTNNEAHFGLFRSDGTQKAEVDEIRDFLTSVRDDGGGEVEVEIVAPEGVHSCVTRSTAWLYRPGTPWDVEPVPAEVATPARTQIVPVGGRAVAVPLD